jgi:hypothetical protein
MEQFNQSGEPARRNTGDGSGRNLRTAGQQIEALIWNWFQWTAACPENPLKFAPGALQAIWIFKIHL